MLSDQTYRQWTSAFSPGSYYRGDWKQGSKILFLAPNPDGSGEGGMVSRIRENRLHEFLSIEMDIEAKEQQNFERMWADALSRLKRIAEA